MDSILLVAIALLILKRIPAGKKLGKGAKAGICVGIAAVVALVFWAMFCRSGLWGAAFYDEGERRYRFNPCPRRW